MLDDYDDHKITAYSRYKSAIQNILSSSKV